MEELCTDDVSGIENWIRENFVSAVCLAETREKKKQISFTGNEINATDVIMTSALVLVQHCRFPSWTVFFLSLSF